MDKGFWKRQLRITWHLPLVLVALAAAGLLFQNWNWLTSHPPRLVSLTGTPQEMGLQHGRILSAEIRSLYDSYVLQGLCGVEGYREQDLIRIGEHYDRFIPDEYREEMRGIAQGSGMPYEKILVINTFADAVVGKTPRACSALAVKTSHGLLVGRNLDWINHRVAHRSGVVFLLHPKDRNAILSVSWPGLVGVVTGMNNQGLCLSLNLAFAGDLEPNAMPCLLRLRQTLETQQSLEEAMRLQTSEPRTIAMNLMIASGREGSASILELSGHQYAIVPMENDHVVTTNHYQALPIHGGSGSDREIILNHRLQGKCAGAGIVDIERALAAVRFLGPSEGMVTNQSVVFVPDQLTAYVAIGKLPATSGRYYPVKLN